MRTLLLDLRYCARSLSKAKGFTLVIVVTLALGIASNVIVFSFINAVLLRPLAYPDAGRLVVLHSQDHLGRSSLDLSAPAFVLLKQRARVFKNIAVIYPMESSVNLSGAGEARYVKTIRVSQSLFKTLGVAPSLGREFQEEEDLPGAMRAVILSDALWSRMFGRRASVLGQTVHVNGEACVIVGVMPARFRSYPDADLWVPLQLSASTADPGNNYRIVARLREGVDLPHADLELKPLSEEYRKAFSPATAAGDLTFVVDDLHDFITGGVRRGLSVLFGAVVFVLMITCTNLALLLVVRAMSRSREVAIRIALGSSRRRIIRLFLIEGCYLGLMGGTASVILAKELLPSALALLPANLSLNATVLMDWRVFLFTAAVVGLIALFFGCAPAMKLSLSDVAEKLRSNSPSSAYSKQQARLAQLLVSLQTALTLVLLAGAVLLLQNFISLRAVPPGFDPGHVAVAQVSLGGNEYQTTAATSRFLDKALDQVRNLPDVESATSVSSLPLELGLNLPVHPMDQPGNIVPVAEYRAISPDYFATLRIRMLAGRDFNRSDDSSASPVVIVNDTLAHFWWPGKSPIGHFVNAGTELGEQLSDVPRQVVGVVSDVHETSLERPTPPVIFVPVKQMPDKITAFSNRLFLTSILVRSRKQADVSGPISAALSSADPNLPVASFRPMTQVVHASIARPRLYASITSTFGAFALLLTTIGMYGLLSYQVRRRVHEIGVRMALGARRASVVGLILTQSVELVAAGTLPGLVAAFFLKGLLDSMLYNLHGETFALLIVAAVLLAAVALMVGLVTAVRAASVEPMEALRNE